MALFSLHRFRICAWKRNEKNDWPRNVENKLLGNISRMGNVQIRLEVKGGWYDEKSKERRQSTKCSTGHNRREKMCSLVRPATDRQGVGRVLRQRQLSCIYEQTERVWRTGTGLFRYRRLCSRLYWRSTSRRWLVIQGLSFYFLK